MLTEITEYSRHKNDSAADRSGAVLPVKSPEISCSAKNIDCLESADEVQDDVSLQKAKTEATRAPQNQEPIRRDSQREQKTKGNEDKQKNSSLDEEETENLEALAAASTIELISSDSKGSGLAARSCCESLQGEVLHPGACDENVVQRPVEGGTVREAQAQINETVDPERSVSDPSIFHLSGKTKGDSTFALESLKDNFRLPFLAPSSSFYGASAADNGNGGRAKRRSLQWQNESKKVETGPSGSGQVASVVNKTLECSAEKRSGRQSLTASEMTPSPPPYSCPSSILQNVAGEIVGSASQKQPLTNAPKEIPLCCDTQYATFRQLSSEIEQLKARLKITEAKSVAACVINVNQGGVLTVKTGNDQSVVVREPVNARAELEPAGGKVTVAKSGREREFEHGDAVLTYMQNCDQLLRHGMADSLNLQSEAKTAAKPDFHEFGEKVGVLAVGLGSDEEGSDVRLRTTTRANVNRDGGIEGSPLMHLAQFASKAAKVPRSSLPSSSYAGQKSDVYSQERFGFQAKAPANAALNNRDIHQSDPAERLKSIGAGASGTAAVVAPSQLANRKPSQRLDSQDRVHHQKFSRPLEKPFLLQPQSNSLPLPHPQAQLHTPHQQQGPYANKNILLSHIYQADASGFMIGPHAMPPKAFIHPDQGKGSSNASSSQSNGRESGFAKFEQFVETNTHSKRQRSEENEEERDTESCDMPTRKKRIRDNWTRDEDDLFFKLVKENESLTDQEIVRLLVTRLAPRRTYQQVKGHLKNMRSANKL